MKRTLFLLVTSGVLLAGMATAQQPAPPPATPKAGAGASVTTPGPAPGQRRQERREMRVFRHRGPGEDFIYFRRGAMGKWWKDADLVKELGVNDNQVQQMEKIFQDYRIRLIDLKAALEKEEARLEPMMEAATPDEAQVVAQIDKVAAARAELEKAHARMGLAVRRVLTADQWKKLQEKHERMGPMHFELPAPPPAPGPPGMASLPEIAPLPDEVN